MNKLFMLHAIELSLALLLRFLLLQHSILFMVVRSRHGHRQYILLAAKIALCVCVLLALFFFAALLGGLFPSNFELLIIQSTLTACKKLEGVHEVELILSFRYFITRKMDGLSKLPPNAVRSPPAYHFIQNLSSGLVLGIKDKDQRIEAKLELQEAKRPKQGHHQHWFLEVADNGELYIFSRLNCMVVDIYQHDSALGTPVIMYYRKSCPLTLANQKWRFLEGGFIQSIMNNQVLEIADGEAKAGQSVVMWTQRAPPENDRQQWELKPVEGNFGQAEMASSSSESGSAGSGNTNSSSLLVTPYN